MGALTVMQPQPSFTMGDMQQVALAIAKGGLFGSSDPNAVLTLCLLAQAEGHHPAVVFRDYHIIKGKPAKKAEAMQRDFLAAGGKIEWLQLEDDCVEATFSHPQGGTATIKWDKKRVVQAELGGNAMHKKYPRQMLRSRVISEGVRTVCPGATSGLYETGEVQDIVAERGEVIEATRDEIAEEVRDDAPPVGDEPAPRSKLDGKHSSKTALQTAIKLAMTKFKAAQSLREVDALEIDWAEDLEQCERYLPLWWNGDPSRDFAGVKATIADKRHFLGIVETMLACETKPQLQNFVNLTGDAIDALPDVGRREFERLFDARSSEIDKMDAVAA